MDGVLRDIYLAAEKKLVDNLFLCIQGVNGDGIDRRGIIGHLERKRGTADGILLIDVMMVQYVLNGGIIMKQHEPNADGLVEEFTVEIS